MRDFYDLYTLYKLKKDEIDYEIFKKAIEKTDGVSVRIMALGRAIRCGNDISESVYDVRD